MSMDDVIHQEVFSCRACTAPVFDDEPYCEVCGAPSPAETIEPVQPAARPRPDRDEWDLGVVAAVTDRGHRRRRNEDAVRIARVGERVVVVVCDGVASTANADLAARTAADAALETLESELVRLERAGTHGVQEAITGAFAAAQEAVARVVGQEVDGNALSPSTTMVVAVATRQQVVVGNVGDSRAYWLGRTPGHGRLLTVDDSWAQASIAEGVEPEIAYADPEAQTITRWIGADSESATPTMTVMDVGEPGLLVVCSDGLWNYFEEPDALAGVTLPGGSRALDVARAYAEAALAAGGQDNVTVAVWPFDPESTMVPGAPRGE